MPPLPPVLTSPVDTLHSFPLRPRREVFLDVGGAFLLIPFGLLPFAFGTLCIALLESLLLAKAFRWPSLRLAFRDTLVANVLSGLVGAVLYFQWPAWPWLGTYLTMYLITVPLEAVILARRRGLGWAHCLRASAVVNAVSYVVLLLVLQGLGLGLW